MDEHTRLERAQRLFWPSFYSSDEEVNAAFMGKGRGGSGYHARRVIENAECALDRFAQELLADGLGDLEPYLIAANMLSSFVDEKRRVASSFDWGAPFLEVLSREGDRAVNEFRMLAATAPAIPPSPKQGSSMRAPSYKEGWSPPDEAMRR